MSSKIPCEGYYRPADLKEAIRMLSTFGETIKPLAGGTDVLPRRPDGKWTTNKKKLLDLSELNLDYIEKREDIIAIGAMTTINTILTAPFFADGSRKILSEAAALHSTHAIRNRATLGGNLCIGWPTADFSCPLLALNAVMVAIGPSGERSIPADQFFTGVNLTELHANELLKEVQIRADISNTGSAYMKLCHHQTSVDMAIVNVAVCLTAGSGACLDATIAMGGAGPIPFRAGEAESFLIGKPLTRTIVESASINAAEQTAPIDDNRATASYRKKMIKVLVGEAILKSMERNEI